jgi:hypothetical protein
MVMFIEVPPAEEDDPAPELDIGSIHRKPICATARKRKKAVPRQGKGRKCHGRARACDADSGWSSSEARLIDLGASSGDGFS